MILPPAGFAEPRAFFTFEKVELHPDSYVLQIGRDDGKLMMKDYLWRQLRDILIATDLGE